MNHFSSASCWSFESVEGWNSRSIQRRAAGSSAAALAASRAARMHTGIVGFMVKPRETLMSNRATRALTPAHDGGQNQCAETGTPPLREIGEPSPREIQVRSEQQSDEQSIAACGR